MDSHYFRFLIFYYICSRKVKKGSHEDVIMHGFMYLCNAVQQWMCIDSKEVR